MPKAFPTQSSATKNNGTSQKKVSFQKTVSAGNLTPAPSSDVLEPSSPIHAEGRNKENGLSASVTLRVRGSADGASEVDGVASSPSRRVSFSQIRGAAELM